MSYQRIQQIQELGFFSLGSLQFILNLLDIKINYVYSDDDGVLMEIFAPPVVHLHIYANKTFIRPSTALTLSCSTDART